MAIIPQNVYYGIKTKYLNKFKIDYQGTVATVLDLPTENIAEGTVYNVESNGSNYLWNGSEWDELGNSGKNSIYCSDCNNALIPGRYYIDENTLNSPDSTAGILTVAGKGGENDDIWQECTTIRNSSAQVLITYKRRIFVSSGVFSSAWPWGGVSVIPRYDRFRSFMESGNFAVFCPPAGRQYTGQSGSYYEFLRLYHTRDASRDQNYTSCGLIGRFVQNTSPTSGDFVNNGITFGSLEGDISSPWFSITTISRCASSVTYTDSTTETVYGKYLVVGDVYNGKTVSTVSYIREADAARLVFEYDNIATLGLASNRFSVLYAATGSIDTSDERLKESIESIPDEVLDAWGEVGWVQYQFKDAVGKKGEDARLHTGAVAQRIDTVFTAHSLDASRYGLFCHDVWEDEFEEDEDGNKIQTRSAGDRYSLRYEEALAMEAAYQRRRADRAEARIKALEDRLETLEARLG